MSTTQYVDISRTLETLETADIHAENVAAIRDLVDHSAAEGVSEVQQVRMAQALKTLLLDQVVSNVEWQPFA